MGDENHKGIGIIDFVQGKNYFITGATGMLGKALVEKILRTIPKVGTIFVLIKAKDMDHTTQRLKNECIKEIHGMHYEAFMVEKIVPVVGNLCEDNVGMDFYRSNLIAQQIHVIVNSAANTTFDERYDFSINANANGPARLLEFAKKCVKLRLFLHVSSAYANGEREGIIKEKAFRMGQCIAWETNSSSLIPSVDINAELKLALDLKESLGNNNIEEINRVLKNFGIERARKHGWRNVYEFTKAMGEMILNSTRGNIPVVIVRPSCIESAYAEPYPGWIQGYRLLEPLFISYGKHQLSGIFADPLVVVDVKIIGSDAPDEDTTYPTLILYCLPQVPLDMVVNCIIAATAKHGRVAKSEMNVYHITSSVSHPVFGGELIDFAYDYFTTFSLLDSKGRKINIKRLKFFKTIHTFVSHLKEERTKSQLSLVETRKIMKQQLGLATLLEPYKFHGGRYDDENTRKLMEEMIGDQKKTFGFDVKNINWEYYIKIIHLPGVQLHIMKEPHKPSRL